MFLNKQNKNMGHVGPIPEIDKQQVYINILFQWIPEETLMITCQNLVNRVGSWGELWTL